MTLGELVRNISAEDNSIIKGHPLELAILGRGDEVGGVGVVSWQPPDRHKRFFDAFYDDGRGNEGSSQNLAIHHGRIYAWKSQKRGTEENPLMDRLFDLRVFGKPSADNKRTMAPVGEVPFDFAEIHFGNECAYARLDDSGKYVGQGRIAIIDDASVVKTSETLKYSGGGFGPDTFRVAELRHMVFIGTGAGQLAGFERTTGQRLHGKRMNSSLESLFDNPMPPIIQAVTAAKGKIYFETHHGGEGTIWEYEPISHKMQAVGHALMTKFLGVYEPSQGNPALILDLVGGNIGILALQNTQQKGFAIVEDEHERMRDRVRTIECHSSFGIKYVIIEGDKLYVKPSQAWGLNSIDLNGYESCSRKIEDVAQAAMTSAGLMFFYKDGQIEVKGKGTVSDTAVIPVGYPQPIERNGTLYFLHRNEQHQAELRKVELEKMTYK